MSAEHMTPALSLDPDEALAAVPNLFERPETEEEEQRRMHISESALTAVDGSATREDRVNAIRHLVGCDPVRGLLAMAELAAGAIGNLEMHYGDEPGTAVRALRQDLANARNGVVVPNPLEEIMRLLGGDGK